MATDQNQKDLASQMAAAYARRTFLPDVAECFGVVLLDAKFPGYKHPQLITAADGVGTKLKLAFLSGNHNTIGNDLVAMVINDLLRRGAKPLGLLCYLATSHIDLAVAERLYKSVAEACLLAQCNYLGQLSWRRNCRNAGLLPSRRIRYGRFCPWSG